MYFNVCPKCHGHKANRYAINCKKCTDYSSWQKGIEKKDKQKEGNINWKGDNASYRAKHNEIIRIKGKAKECSICGKKDGRIHWANIDHKYRRNEKDYISMCPSCHGHYDKINNLRKNNIISDFGKNILIINTQTY